MKRTFEFDGPITLERTDDIPWRWKATAHGHFLIESTRDIADCSASVWAEAFGRTKHLAKRALLELVRA